MPSVNSFPLRLDKTDRKFYNIAIGYSVVICGLLVLTGWEFDNALLRNSEIRPMNPMSAVTFILCGIWLILYFSNEKKNAALQNTLCYFVIFFGLLHTFTYFYPSLGFRMDYILFRKKIISDSSPELIPPNTGIGFILAGFVMATTFARHQAMHVLRQTSVMLLLLVSYVSILGFVFQIQPQFTLGGFTPMSLFSGIAFFLLSCGLLLSGKRFAISKMITSNLTSGALIRAAIPFILVLPPVIGYFRLRGEKLGYYPSEFGVEINTMAFVISVAIFLTFYFSLESKKQLVKVRSDLRLAIGEQKYRALFNSIKEGVVSVSFEGKIVFCNPSFCKITGYAEDELIGKNAIEYLIPATNAQNFYEKFSGAAGQTQEIYREEIIKKNGDKIWISVKSNPLTDHKGMQYGYIATIDDITEEIMQIEDLSAFTVSAAHDLNSPISRIITVADIMNATQMDDEQRMFLGIMTQTAFSMQDLLRDLLLFSKLGHEQLSKSTLNLNDIILTTCEQLKPADFKGAIENKPVPPVAGNEGAIKRLYANLISNAFKYSAIREYPCIETGCYHNGDITVYYVKDNGSGVDPAFISQMFTPFKRFHTGIDGNGMGLAIVKRIVEKHGGSIWAEPNTAGGIIICFTLSTQSTKGANQPA